MSILQMAGHPAFKCQGPTLGTADLPAWRPAHLRLRVWKRGEPEVSQMPSDFLCPLWQPLFVLLLAPPWPRLLLALPLPPPAVASVLLWALISSAGPTTTSICSMQHISRVQFCSAAAQHKRHGGTLADPHHLAAARAAAPVWRQTLLRRCEEDWHGSGRSAGDAAERSCLQGKDAGR